MKCYDGISQVRDALNQLRKLRSQLRDLIARAGQDALADAIAALDKKAAAIEGAGSGRSPGAPGAGGGEPSLSRISGELLALMDLVEGADVTPTTQAAAASEQVQQTLSGVLSHWRELKDEDVKALNEQLRQAGLQPIHVER
jgi:hypothetical protein